MAEYIEREAALSLVRPDAPEDEKAAVTIATAKKLVRDIVCRTPAADVAPVVHGRCPVCSGKEVLAQDCDNGYCVEIDAEQAEMTIWQGDTCLAVISIDFCPNCGARMDGDDDGQTD